MYQTRNVLSTDNEVNETIARISEQMLKKYQVVDKKALAGNDMQRMDNLRNIIQELATSAKDLHDGIESIGFADPVIEDTYTRQMELLAAVEKQLSEFKEPGFWSKLIGAKSREDLITELEAVKRNVRIASEAKERSIKESYNTVNQEKMLNHLKKLLMAAIPQTEKELEIANERLVALTNSQVEMTVEYRDVSKHLDDTRTLFDTAQGILNNMKEMGVPVGTEAEAAEFKVAYELQLRTVRELQTELNATEQRLTAIDTQNQHTQALIIEAQQQIQAFVAHKKELETLRDRQLFTFEQKMRSAKANRLLDSTNSLMTSMLTVTSDSAQSSLESAVVTQRRQKDHLNDKLILADNLYDEAMAATTHQQEIQGEFNDIAESARSKRHRLIG